MKRLISNWTRPKLLAIYTLALAAALAGCNSHSVTDKNDVHYHIPKRNISVEQAVIVHFRYGSTDLARLFALEDRLKKAIDAAKAGDFDGDEITTDGSDGFLYMYGPDADRLFEAVLPVLESAEFMHGAKVQRRYGPATGDAREVTVTIGVQKKS